VGARGVRGASVHNRGMNARFHAPDAQAPGEVVPLPDDEAEHLTRVLRLKPGDVVRVFNGRGGEFDAVVEQAGKTGALVRVGAAQRPAPEARVAITLAQAALKGDKMDDVVRDAVMLGVAVILPIVTERAEVTRASLARGQRRDRWQRIAISSAKQCGRATVPAILEPLDLGALVEALAKLTLPQPALMFVEPDAGHDATRLSELDLSPQRAATVIIGPEGGWTDSEIEHGASVARLVTLGGRTLRADAMPVVALAALFTIWGEF
jgi:16S rRNA (uracil1498-N3)-methyltransferase